MRRTIRLTGRRQLTLSAFGFRFAELQGKQIATLTLVDPAEMKAFPPDAEIRVKLVENKLVEILRFGTIAKPITTAEVIEASFLAPSCQIRVVSRTQDKEGMLLGSTTRWTYKSGSDPDGILLFEKGKTAPRSWKLDFSNEEDHPVLYIDERIPDAALWAKTDPVFIGCVFPHVIGEVMARILQLGSTPEDGWMKDWVVWAEALMPGTKPPFGEKIDTEQREWIDQLIETFAFRHELADNLLKKLEVPV